jgi:ElaB/YqjD/DUF883 family membrane-anchored ribosome-binding protein
MFDRQDLTRMMTSSDPHGDDYFDIGAADVEIMAPRPGLFGAIESRLIDLAEDGKRELLRSFDGVVLGAHELAANIDSVAGAQVGAFVRDAATMLENLQTQLRDKPVDALLDDGRDFIRQSPRLAIGVAIAAGFITARLAKAASQPRRP